MLSITHSALLSILFFPSQPLPLVIAFSVMMLMGGILTLIGALIISSMLFSILSGWSRLARHYSTETEFVGKKWHHQSGRLGSVGLRRVLMIGVNTAGLFIAVPFFLRVGNPPLFIPWHDISVTEHEGFRYYCVQFAFSKVPSVRLQTPRKLGDQLLADWVSTRSDQIGNLTGGPIWNTQNKKRNHL
jgi:hypothetical protein